MIREMSIWEESMVVIKWKLIRRNELNKDMIGLEGPDIDSPLGE